MKRKCPHCGKLFSERGFKSHVARLHRWPNSPTRKAVDFLDDEAQMEILILASLGYSTLFIKKQTGFSESQIIYRLRLAAISRLDYRDGKSPVAKAVLDASYKSVRSELRKEVDHRGRKQPPTRKAS